MIKGYGEIFYQLDMELIQLFMCLEIELLSFLYISLVERVSFLGSKGEVPSD